VPENIETHKITHIKTCTQITYISTTINNYTKWYFAINTWQAPLCISRSQDRNSHIKLDYYACKAAVDVNCLHLIPYIPHCKYQTKEDHLCMFQFYRELDGPALQNQVPTQMGKWDQQQRAYVPTQIYKFYEEKNWVFSCTIPSLGVTWILWDFRIDKQDRDIHGPQRQAQSPDRFTRLLVC
jgi:hypothetical protein